MGEGVGVSGVSVDVGVGVGAGASAGVGMLGVGVLWCGGFVPVVAQVHLSANLVPEYQAVPGSCDTLEQLHTHTQAHTHTRTHHKSAESCCGTLEQMPDVRECVGIERERQRKRERGE